MKSPNPSGLKTATPGLKTPNKRRFRDPRLSWMDEVLRSLRKPAPESWIPASYRYLYQQQRKPNRPVH